MRWMVTGAGGALGTDLVRALSDDDVTATTRDDLDVTDAAAVREALHAWARPGEAAVVLNAAAFTAVDAAETEPDAAGAAWAVNADGPGHLADACAETGARLVHVSTDYVFPGDATRPYEPTDPPGPTGVYARSKFAGEQRVRAVLPHAHHVVRTAWLYGDAGPSFVRTVARLVAERDTFDVVDDQHGSPTWSGDLARALVALGRRDVAPGTLHAAGAGVTTWYGLARAVVAECGADPDRVRPCSTDRFPRPAPRPAYSALSSASWRAAGLTPLPAWREALTAAAARHPTLLGSVRA